MAANLQGVIGVLLVEYRWPWVRNNQVNEESLSTFHLKQPNRPPMFLASVYMGGSSCLGIGAPKNGAAASVFFLVSLYTIRKKTSRP